MVPVDLLPPHLTDVLMNEDRFGTISPFPGNCACSAREEGRLGGWFHHEGVISVVGSAGGGIQGSYHKTVVAYCRLEIRLKVRRPDH